MDRDFRENEEGVHLMLGEFSLCGDAFDIDSEGEVGALLPTRKRTVTCLRCIDIILMCRGVRMNQEGG